VKKVRVSHYDCSFGGGERGRRRTIRSYFCPGLIWISTAGVFHVPTCGVVETVEVLGVEDCVSPFRGIEARYGNVRKVEGQV
jgi:hypothetical protein